MLETDGKRWDVNYTNHFVVLCSWYPCAVGLTKPNLSSGSRRLKGSCCVLINMFVQQLGTWCIYSRPTSTKLGYSIHFISFVCWSCLKWGTSTSHCSWQFTPQGQAKRAYLIYFCKKNNTINMHRLFHHENPLCVYVSIYIVSYTIPPTTIDPEDCTLLEESNLPTPYVARSS